MANGKDTIEQVRELVRDPRTLTGKAAQILTLTLLSELYDKWNEDHKKIDEMYPTYKAGRWAGTVVIGTAITSGAMLLINGFIYFIKILPVLNDLSKIK